MKCKWLERVICTWGAHQDKLPYFCKGNHAAKCENCACFEFPPLGKIEFGDYLTRDGHKAKVLANVENTWIGVHWADNGFMTAQMWHDDGKILKDVEMSDDLVEKMR